VDAPAESLEEIVRAELREPAVEIVRRLVLDLAREELDRIAASLNGKPEPRADLLLRGSPAPQDEPRALPPTSDLPPSPAASSRLCRLCGQLKPPSDFERGRHQCRACRREGARRPYRERQERAIARAANGSEPEPPG
jgi:hypothetical protein